jgi:hypothetical protein
MLKKIIGGVIVLVIGGTTYSISQKNVVDNFSKNTGLTQQQAQDYIKNIPASDLASFSKVGQGYVSDGNTVLNELPSIDCANYSYKWETSLLTCQEGRNELEKVGNDEIALGNCYEALDTNLGSSAGTKINECISDIDTVDADYTLPVVVAVLDSKTVTDSKNTNAYNKSVLEAALSAK